MNLYSLKINNVPSVEIKGVEKQMLFNVSAFTDKMINFFAAFADLTGVWHQIWRERERGRERGEKYSRARER
jgi:hypothetical protein